MLNNFNPMLLTDFYKVSHREQYPKGTTNIYSTWTPRNSQKKGIDRVVAFGFQGFVKKYLIDYFNDNFFSKPKKECVEDYIKIVSNILNSNNIDSSHIEKLHDLGYLPLEIKTIKEGMKIPIKVPILTIENTLPEFFWITNFIETLLSCQLWQTVTNATVADAYKKLLLKYANETSDDLEFVLFQGHDFSMRGMSSLESSCASSSAHLLSFLGTDSIPAIGYLRNYYNADIENELICSSIPATEHSVMCAYGKENEFETYKRLITEVYPNGNISIVSDTWDLWNVLDVIIRKLKQDILNRDGKVVIRPDSGDPVLITCGNPNGKTKLEKKGVIQILWDIFGGTTNSKGYKELDKHIGCIYGDAITMERCEEILKKLKEKGFSSSNIVFGIGSYSYQYNTRDAFGFALKSTYANINGEERMLYKDPITDNGIKKSQCGRVVVLKQDGEIIYKDHLLKEQQKQYFDKDLLSTIFLNGKLVKETNLKEIRKTLINQ